MLAATLPLRLHSVPKLRAFKLKTKERQFYFPFVWIWIPVFILQGEHSSRILHRWILQCLSSVESIGIRRVRVDQVWYITLMLPAASTAGRRPKCRKFSRWFGLVCWWCKTTMASLVLAEEGGGMLLRNFVTCSQVFTMSCSTTPKSQNGSNETSFQWPCHFDLQYLTYWHFINMCSIRWRQTILKPICCKAA